MNAQSIYLLRIVLVLYSLKVMHYFGANKKDNRFKTG